MPRQGLDINVLLEQTKPSHLFCWHWWAKLCFNIANNVWVGRWIHMVGASTRSSWCRMGCSSDWLGSDEQLVAQWLGCFPATWKIQLCCTRPCAQVRLRTLVIMERKRSEGGNEIMDIRCPCPARQMSVCVVLSFQRVANAVQENRGNEMMMREKGRKRGNFFILVSRN